MPANTGAPYNLPYPLAGESPDGPAQIQSLALAVAAAITSATASVAATAAAATATATTNSASALSSAVTTINATTGSLSSRIAALESLNISSRLIMAESDTGWLSSGGFANASGWVASLYRYRILMGKFVFLEIDTQRTGTTIQSDSTGQFGDVDVITIPAAARPYATWYGSYDGQDTSGGFSVSSSTGMIQVRDCNSNANIGNSDMCRFRACYIKVS